MLRRPEELVGVTLPLVFHDPVLQKELEIVPVLRAKCASMWHAYRFALPTGTCWYGFCAQI